MRIPDEIYIIHQNISVVNTIYPVRVFINSRHCPRRLAGWRTPKQRTQILGNSEWRRGSSIRPCGSSLLYVYEDYSDVPTGKLTPLYFGRGVKRLRLLSPLGDHAHDSPATSSMPLTQQNSHEILLFSLW